MIKFFKALLGALGFIKLYLQYKVTDQEVFLRDLPNCSILLTRKRNRPIGEIGFWKWLSNFFGRGIEAVTGQLWSHTMLYVGKIKGKHMIIESLDFVKERSLDHYLNDPNIQLEAWSRPLTAKQQHLILREARKCLGNVYDLVEIVSHLFKWIPHPKRLVVCATLVAKAFSIIEKVVNDGIIEGNESPGDIPDYCINRLHWSRRRNNC